MDNTTIVIAGYVASALSGALVALISGWLSQRNSRADRVHSMQFDVASQAMEYIQAIVDFLDYYSCEEWEVGQRPAPPKMTSTYAIQARLELVLPQCAALFATAVRTFHDTRAWGNENLAPDEALPKDKSSALESAIRAASDSLRAAVR